MKVRLFILEYIIFGYILNILFHMSRNETVLRFEVLLNIEKQGYRNHYMNN